MKCSLREWQKILKSPNDLIVNASVIDGSDSWTEYPIGMEFSIVFFKSKSDKFQIGNHEKIVNCCFSTNTDNYRRPNPPNRISFLKTLEMNGIKNRKLTLREYFYTLPSYKFMISPEGNGIDSHRIYESLIAGTIPIVEDNILIRQKYKNMPVLYTKDYTEITEFYLLKKYNEMIDIEYDFSPLFRSYWPEYQQKLIKQSSDYWTYTKSGHTYYDINISI